MGADFYRYFYQITVGCGHSNCSFSVCASNENIPQFATEVAAVMAVQLASSEKVMFCPRLPIESSMAHKSLQSLFSISNSAPTSANHSRANSVEVLGRDRSLSEQPPEQLKRDGSKPFLHSLFSFPSFHSLFSGESAAVSLLNPLQAKINKESQLHHSHVELQPASDASSDLGIYLSRVTNSK